MPARITEETVHALVNLIYEAAFDASQWPAFLRAFASAIETRGTIIYTHNFETLDASTASSEGFPNAVVGFDEQFMSVLEEYYNHVNVWAQNEAMLKPGRPVTGSMLYPERKLPKTEFYQDWLRPQDYFHAIGGIIMRDGPCAMKFSSLRSRRSGDFTAAEIRLYQTLLPHLARAANIQRRFVFLQGLSNASLALLDTVPAAIVLLDASGRALHSNAAAQTELRRGDPLLLSRSGDVTVRGAAHGQTALRAAIAAALDPVRSAKERRATVAQLPRRNGEMLSLQALALPQGQHSDLGCRFSRSLAACALVIHDGQARIPMVGAELLRHVYGLTPAEVQVAIAMAEGETLKRYAERRHISRNTASSQLKSAFQKTGLRRQSELVRWLLSSSAALQPGAIR